MPAEDRLNPWSMLAGGFAFAGLIDALSRDDRATVCLSVGVVLAALAVQFPPRSRRPAR